MMVNYYLPKLFVFIPLFLFLFQPFSFSIIQQPMEGYIDICENRKVIDFLQRISIDLPHTLLFEDKSDDGLMIDQNQTVNDDSAVTFTTDEYYVAQRFQPSIQILTNISLLLSKQESLSEEATFFVSIRRFLHIESEQFEIDASKISSGNASWIMCDIPFMTVNINQSYYLVCHATGVSDESGIQWFFGLDDPYIRGEPFISEDGKEWDPYHYDSSQIDFCFKTYGYKNTKPKPPIKPVGPTEGKFEVEYKYHTKTVDAEKDSVFYKWNWGDGSVSEWLGPYESKEICEASHTWMIKGSYYVKVKAKDRWGFESEWSDLLTIRMEKKKSSILSLRNVDYLSWIHS